MEYYVRSDLKDNIFKWLPNLFKYEELFLRSKQNKLMDAGAGSNVIDWEITLCEIAIMNWEMLFKNFCYDKYTSLNFA